MGRTLMSSALLALATERATSAAAITTAAFCGNPLLCRGVRATSRQERIEDASRSPLCTRPAIRLPRRRGHSTMDTGEDFDQLGGVS